MKNPNTLLLLLIALIVFVGGYFYLDTTNTEPSYIVTDEQVSVSTTDSAATSSTEERNEDARDTSEPQPVTIIALDVKSWEWVSATYADGRTLTPNTAGDFVMTFGAGGGVSFSTDCNSMSSSYEAYTGGLAFAPIASTKMYCEGSRENEFAALISETKTYRFTDKGELVLETKTGDILLFK
jgi:heat shock protein HslJ